MTVLSALGHIGIAQETTYGTAVAPAKFIPYLTVKSDNEIKKVTDNGIRAALSKDWGVYNTTRQGVVEIEANAHPEILGYFLKGILGGYPAPVSTTVSTPSTAPTLAAAANAGSTLPAATYYVVYTWANANGETLISPEASQAITSGQQLNITIPALPAGATSANIYVSTSTGTETRQANITGTTLSISAPLVAGAAKPSSSTIGTVYTHTFNVANAQPPSFTISDYNSMTERQYAGAVMQELQFKFDTETALTMNAKLISKMSVTTTTATPTFTTSNPLMGFQTKLTLGATQNLNLVGGEFSIKRDSALLFTANQTQDPTKFSGGRISVSGKLTFDCEDETELLKYLNGTQETLDILIQRDANTSIDFHCSLVDYSKATVDRSQEFVRVDLEFLAIANATDAGMCVVTLKNSVSSY